MLGAQLVVAAAEKEVLELAQRSPRLRAQLENRVARTLGMDLANVPITDAVTSALALWAWVRQVRRPGMPALVRMILFPALTIDGLLTAVTAMAHVSEAPKP